MGGHDETLEVKRWLRELREQAGMSQEELAERIGVGRKTVWNAESPDQGLPRALPLLRTLRVFGVVADAPVLADDSIDLHLRELADAVARLADQLEAGALSVEARLAAIECRLPPSPAALSPIGGDTAEGGMT